MQLSHYLKVYPIEEKPGYRLLFSTRKASVILIPAETWHDLQKGALSPPDAAILAKLGMIVEDRTAEKRSMLGLLDTLNKKNTNLKITVVLNLDCNFDCRYCYEGDMKGHRYMSDQTAEHLIGFIKDRFTAEKTSLRVDFFGGEPLLSIEQIKSISQALKSLTESRRAAYRFTLITNGALFTRKVAEELTPLGLKSVKITLDGPAEIHNRYRPFKSGAGSFETIIKNIQTTRDLVKISIGGNYEESNYQQFPLLLDDLIERGLTPDKIPIVKFDPVMKSPQGNISPSRYKGGCISLNEPWLVGAEAFLRKAILKRGYHTPKPKPIVCMIETADAFVVNFDGVIYKCPAFICQEGFAVGDIQSGVRDYTDSYKLGIWKNEDCAECEYLPLCFGGCRYMTWVRNGNIDALDCKKSYLDASLETLIKQDIRYRQKAS